MRPSLPKQSNFYSNENRTVDHCLLGSPLEVILGSLKWDFAILGIDEWLLECYAPSEPIPPQNLAHNSQGLSGQVIDLPLVPCKPVPPVPWSNHQRLNQQPHQTHLARRVCGHPAGLKIRPVKGRMSSEESTVIHREGGNGKLPLLSSLENPNGQHKQNKTSYGT